MRLVNHVTGEDVKIGDIVFDDTNGDSWRITHFAEPHKPSSSGKVTVEAVDGDSWSREFYVSVFHLEWIERGDRNK